MGTTDVAIERAVVRRRDVALGCPEGEGSELTGHVSSASSSRSRRQRWGVVGAAVVVGVLELAGCGSSSSSATSGGGAAGTTTSSASQTSAQSASQPAQSGPGGVCGLATQSEVDTAAGVSLAPAALGPAATSGSSKCSWSVPGQPATGLVVQGITVAVITPPPGVPVANLPFFNGKANGKPIAGLGDMAASVSPGQLGPGSVQIFVSAHGSLVTLSLANGGSPHTSDPVQSMTTLARAVIGRFSG